MVSLIDRGGLHITVQDLRDPQRRRFCFSFKRVAAYRNILEEYRTSDLNAHRFRGRTGLHANSAWLADLRRREPLLDFNHPGCRHYVIWTEDDVVDVLASEAPAIVEVAPAEPADPAPGKSNILYHPEDRAQIDALLDDIGRLGGDA